MKKNIRRIILICLIITWMYVVFGLSGDNGKTSSGLSISVSRIFSENDDIVFIIEPIIRKIAHLSEYAARWIFILCFVFNIYNVGQKTGFIFGRNGNNLCNNR